MTYKLSERNTTIWVTTIIGHSASSNAFSETEQPNNSAYNLSTFTVQDQRLGYSTSYGSTALKTLLPIIETPQSLFAINNACIDETYYKADRLREINVERPREVRLSVQHTF
ncbi:hypothetical protein MLD52_07250 [Puniceicoccaceae bacterium K14]|nr:hypothetical protein [Puniceicoccaceae bacterium K14]